ncbi:DinB family protein [Streptomyces physcomitrii]|uniref:DinB family protein n=1 Tax=Streptomyces physcomitrii TaxID=2724184 RepID=UPI0033C188BA
MSTGTTPDGRAFPPPRAGERATLESWLDFHRATLELKCAGLDDAQLRLAPVPPSSMTLLGLVQHLAEIERNWFQRVFAGLRVPPVYEEGGPDAFTLSPDRGIEEALAAWRAEVARSREITAAALLEDTGIPPAPESAYLGEEGVSLRWILVHLIEEYARHNGHADLIRECLDGTTGA